jgi:hypothetical protein
MKNSSRRWRQQSPPKRWYPTTSLHGVITQQITTWISIQALLTSPWKWGQHGPPKPWHPTTSLRGVTTQKAMTWIINLRSVLSQLLFSSVRNKSKSTTRPTKDAKWQKKDLENKFTTNNYWGGKKVSDFVIRISRGYEATSPSSLCDT